VDYLFDFGDAVRVIRNVKDDGTYPGANVGQLLVRRGSIGQAGIFSTPQPYFLTEEALAGAISAIPTNSGRPFAFHYHGIYFLPLRYQPPDVNHGLRAACRRLCT
jgi:hypothetical protein